jgi:hypothetical protein
MPKKLHLTLEPAVTFNGLLAEFLEVDKSFTLKTNDPAVPSFAAQLIEDHYPPQSQLPLD